MSETSDDAMTADTTQWKGFHVVALINSEGYLVMNLQEQLGAQTLGPQATMDQDHSALDDVARRSLHHLAVCLQRRAIALRTPATIGSVCVKAYGAIGIGGRDRGLKLLGTIASLASAAIPHAHNIEHG